MKFIFDKQNFNNPVNIEHVVGIFAPDTPSEKLNYYILFYTVGSKNIFWTYNTKEDRDFILNNYLLPKFEYIQDSV